MDLTKITCVRMCCTRSSPKDFISKIFLSENIIKQKFSHNAPHANQCGHKLSPYPKHSRIKHNRG